MVTIRDVAEAAGVSTATVSRVFNGSARVDAGTKRRVVVAARRLEYWPNSAARSLTTSRSHSIGVLLPDLFGEFFSEIIRGIDHAARLEKFQILVSSSHADAAELLAAVRSMNGRIDGLIAMALDRSSGSLIRRVSRSIPVVLMNTGSRIRGCSAISVANVEGAREMGRHLREMGHRRMAIVTGPDGNIDAADRLKGFREAFAAGGRRRAALVEIPGDFTESSGYAAAARILALRPRPTAVFTSNDYMAVGLLSALRRAGIRVPDDIAVTGFDDIAIAQYLNPPLTTVHVDAYEEGRRAVRLLLSRLAGGSRDGAATPAGGETTPAAARRPTRATSEVLPTRLVVRDSCGSRAPFIVSVDRRRPAPVRLRNRVPA